jgi:hypothetical protein
VQEQIMKDRKNQSGRQQGDTGRQNQWQQSQQPSRDDRPHKGSNKSHQQDSAHRTQQR